MLILLVQFSRAEVKFSKGYTKLEERKNWDNFFRRSTFFRMDKLKHFTFSIYITTTTYYVMNRMMSCNSLQSRQSAAGISFSLGIVKESYDNWIKEEKFRIPDIIADVAGTAVGLLIINRIENG
jgi:uncharacterized protein YfiM (DUF2279 family)